MEFTEKQYKAAIKKLIKENRRLTEAKLPKITSFMDMVRKIDSISKYLTKIHPAIEEVRLIYASYDDIIKVKIDLKETRERRLDFTGSHHRAPREIRVDSREWRALETEVLWAMFETIQEKIGIPSNAVAMDTREGFIKIKRYYYGPGSKEWEGSIYDR